MIDIVICEELKKICPEITLGCIQAHVDVEISSGSLLREINDYCEILKEEIAIEDLSTSPRINAGREVYKKLGKVPSKYRLSSEALVRRILQGKGIYKVNNIVDINNLISIKSKFSVGSYNVNNLHSPIYLMIGKEGNQYKGIGKEIINIENLPVLTDSSGCFGSPTSDSERTMITNDAREVLMCMYSFSGKTDMEEYLEYGKELLEKYAKGKDIKIKIIE